MNADKKRVRGSGLVGFGGVKTEWATDSGAALKVNAGSCKVRVQAFEFAREK
jgi:hypothetical protein